MNPLWTSRWLLLCRMLMFLLLMGFPVFEVFLTEAPHKNTSSVDMPMKDEGEDV